MQFSPPHWPWVRTNLSTPARPRQATVQQRAVATPIIEQDARIGIKPSKVGDEIDDALRPLMNQAGEYVPQKRRRSWPDRRNSSSFLIPSRIRVSRAFTFVTLVDAPILA